MKVGSVVNTALLILNLSLLLTQFMEWRGGSVWLWVVGSALVVTLVIFWFAHVWTNSMDMVRALRRASAIHDPCQVYQLAPWERAVWINVLIPQLECQIAVANAVGARDSAANLQRQVEKMRRWESLGYIPRDEYPRHLLKYYWQTDEPL